MMSHAPDQLVQCPTCYQMVELKLMQSSHLDEDCPGQPSDPDVVPISNLLNEKGARRKNKSVQRAGDFLSEDRWVKRKAIAVSAHSLMSPGLRHLGKTRQRKASADDKALDALLSNSIDHAALDSIKLMVSQGISLPPEAFPNILFGILEKNVSLRMATACCLTATELLQMDPLVWVPIDNQCDRFWQVFTKIVGSADQYIANNDMVAFRKSMMFARIFILAFHNDIRQRKSEGLDCRDSILSKQIEMESAKKGMQLGVFREELDQVHSLAQITVANESSQIPKRFRVEALGLAESFQRLMNNCFPDN